MVYMGSKSRVAKYIVPILNDEIQKNGSTCYFEPFVGGCNVIDKIKCDVRVGADNNKWLIALLNHVKDGGELPESVDKATYDAARAAYYANDTSEFPAWKIGAIGFIASYNGRFFDGGYGNRYEQQKRNILLQAPLLKDIPLFCQDYRDTTVHKNYLVYCDPPYKNTKKYNTSKNFDYDQFWDIVRLWSKTCPVFVSEQEAPDDFELVWSKEVKRTINVKEHKPAIEGLWRTKR